MEKFSVCKVARYCNTYSPQCTSMEESWSALPQGDVPIVEALAKVTDGERNW